MVSPQPLYLLLSSPRPSTRSSQPRIIAWLCLGISSCSRSSSHLRLLYSSGREAPGKTQVGADLGLHHPGNPRACTPNGQLQAMSEHHPAPAQLFLHGGGQRVVLSGHSQPLQLPGLGISLPLICQQQSRLSYKKEGVLSPHKVRTLSSQLG